MLNTLEWTGSLLGLLGAYLLATHSRVSRYGWLAFLDANSAMLAFALGIERYGLLVQQAGFMATSLIGLRRAGLWPGYHFRKPLRSRRPGPRRTRLIHDLSLRISSASIHSARLTFTD